MYIELQCDGLVGPTHHYAGLSHGNVASEANARSISQPRKAALQGLEKMRFVHELGIPVLVVPPQPRPNLTLLERLGFDGDAETMIAEAAASNPRLLSAAFSASSMWTANMATVSPVPDTADRKLHLTPANLVSTLHRAQEADFSYSLLMQLFRGVPDCAIHPPLPAASALGDEGAANQLRLCGSDDKAGVEIFVYGRADDQEAAPRRFPARQTKLACEVLVRQHQLSEQASVLVQQNPAAIDAGVFHNDVIAMSNGNVLIYHEQAFLNTHAMLDELTQKLRLAPLLAVEIKEEDFSLKEAVKSYFFNSQLLTLPDGGMCIIAPAECREIVPARKMLERLVQQDTNPIAAVHYLDIRESMKNGGGPACLRLRVPMRRDYLSYLPEKCLYSDSLHAQLTAIIEGHYPETLTTADFLGKHFLRKNEEVFERLYQCLALEKA